MRHPSRLPLTQICCALQLMMKTNSMLKKKLCLKAVTMAHEFY